jgi:hypothetical protein
VDSELPSVAKKPRRPTAGPAAYILIGLLVVGGGLFYLASMSGRAVKDTPLTPKAKAYARSLQLSDVSMKATESYLKQRVIEIEGKIANAGDKPLEVVEIHCSFYDSYGQLVRRQRVAIVSSRMGGLKPGEAKSFRLPFDDVPESWNQQMPSLVIAGIKFL